MDRSGKTILVVDDEPDLALALAEMLEGYGYRVMEAHSAEEAWKRIQVRRPDLITCDLMMPRRSGIAFYQALKRDAGCKDVPVIFISAFSQPRDFSGPAFRKLVPDASVPEPAGFLEKPVQVEKLLALIRGAIG